MNKWHVDIFLVKTEGFFFLIFHDAFAKFDIIRHTLSVLSFFYFSFQLSRTFACLRLLLPPLPIAFWHFCCLLSLCGLASSIVCACLIHNYLYFWTWTILNSPPLCLLLPLFHCHSWMTLCQSFPLVPVASSDTKLVGDSSSPWNLLLFTTLLSVSSPTYKQL